MQNYSAFRPRLFIAPEDIAGLRIERNHLTSRSGYEHRTVIDQGSGFMHARLAGNSRPDQAQLRHVARVDLIERAIAPAVIGAANHQPIAFARVFQALRGDGRIILQEDRHGRRGSRFSLAFPLLLLGAARALGREQTNTDPQHGDETTDGNCFESGRAHEHLLKARNHHTLRGGAWAALARRIFAIRT